MQVDDDRGPERDVVELVRVADDVSDPPGRVSIDAGDRREPAELRHLAEEVIRDHAVGQRQHQEVDAETACGDEAEDQPDQRRDDEREHERDRRVPAQRQALGLAARPALRDHVPEQIGGDAHQRRLRERGHAAVRRQEDQARRGDPEDEHLGEDRAHPVVVEERRPEREEDEHRRRRSRARRCAFGSRLALIRPSRRGPCGRNASTIAISTNVSTIEYCEQQLSLVIGRYAAENVSTSA